MYLNLPNCEGTWVRRNPDTIHYVDRKLLVNGQPPLPGLWFKLPDCVKQPEQTLLNVWKVYGPDNTSALIVHIGSLDIYFFENGVFKCASKEYFKRNFNMGDLR